MHGDKTTSPKGQITVVILAGGRARRMGGQDKGLIELDGKAMVEYVIAALAPQVGKVLINANRNLPQYRRFGYPVVTDRLGNFLGPLAGMASAMQAADTEYLLTVPCDSPLVPADLADTLYLAMSKEEAEISVAHDGQRMQPVFALLRRGLLSSVVTFLAAGGRRVDTWYARHKVALADFSNRPETFLNVNTWGDRNALEERIKKGQLMLRNAHIPILGFTALSGTGKTTLLVKVLPLLIQRGIRVGVVKHAHHRFEIDHPGKDSYRLFEAGASPMLIASRNRWAMIVETDEQDEPMLDDLLRHLDQDSLDLILVEGFKHEHFSKIELYRSSLGHPMLFLQDPSVVAVATDAPIPVPPEFPLLDINRPDQVASFIIEHLLSLKETARPTV